LGLLIAAIGSPKAACCPPRAPKVRDRLRSPWLRLLKAEIAFSVWPWCFSFGLPPAGGAQAKAPTISAEDSGDSIQPPGRRFFLCRQKRLPSWLSWLERTQLGVHRNLIHGPMQEVGADAST